MTLQAVNPVAASYADVTRVGGYIAARSRVARLGGTPPVSAVSAVKPVDASFEVERYAEVLSDATSYATDARRSAWSNGDPRSEFPPSAPAALALASLFTGDPGQYTAPGSGSIRNVTPGLVSTNESEASAATATASAFATGAGGVGRGIVIDAPAWGAYANGARSYREVASLVA